MIVARTRAELTGRHGRRAVVMTMGALHEGHLALVRRARELGEEVVVSIFVNPLQFGPTEDLDRYPRDLEADLALLEAEGVDLVFAPDVSQMYPAGEPAVRVSAGPLGRRLEGEHRPGHFDGVLTVVLKLLHLLAPDVALFGQKDAQQLMLVRQLVADLDVPVEIEAVATVREPDGLAMSSRNAYLSREERGTARALYQALEAGAAAAEGGAVAPEVVGTAARVLAGTPLEVDYVVLVDPVSGVDVSATHRGPALLALAARVGSTRLIDNMLVHLREESR